MSYFEIGIIGLWIVLAVSLSMAIANVHQRIDRILKRLKEKKIVEEYETFYE